MGGASEGAAASGIEIEATGGITLANVRAYAEAGADYVSIGALTHSVTAADLGIEVVSELRDLFLHRPPAERTPYIVDRHAHQNDPQRNRGILGSVASAFTTILTEASRNSAGTTG